MTIQQCNNSRAAYTHSLAPNMPSKCPINNTFIHPIENQLKAMLRDGWSLKITSVCFNDYRQWIPLAAHEKPTENVQIEKVYVFRSPTEKLPSVLGIRMYFVCVRLYLVLYGIFHIVICSVELKFTVTFVHLWFVQNVWK